MIDKDPSVENLQINTFRFYETHADSLIKKSRLPNGSEWTEPFVSLLFPHAHILDAGCGAGYASQYFIQQGFTITAFDGSEALVRFSSKLIQQPVHHLKYEDLTFENEFDGIWACASLLHVPQSHMQQVVHRLSIALKMGGIFYTNFVYGEAQTSRNGLLFNDYTEDKFQAVLADEKSLQLLRMWKSPDLPPARPNRKWLHVLVQKTGSQ